MLSDETELLADTKFEELKDVSAAAVVGRFNRGGVTRAEKSGVRISGFSDRVFTIPRKGGLEVSGLMKMFVCKFTEG
jgi:hypothetical protein